MLLGDWVRALFYARRIKQLSHHYFYSALESPEFEGSIFFLSVYRPVLSIFLNLQLLKCQSTDMLDYIHIFLGPRLETLTLSPLIKTSENAVVRLISSIALMSPSLRHMTIDVNPFFIDPHSRNSEVTLDLQTEFCNMASSLPCLKTLQFVALPMSKQL